jgi:uncharacterized protein YndB with AHSA1/START domain
MSARPEPTADREIVTTRVYDAPRELVFAAWTTPEHLARWWGPNGFTTTTLEMTFAVGGAWRFIMHGPDGVDYPNRIRYREIVRPERLVYLHDADGAGDPGFESTITFIERDGQTTLTMRALFPSAAMVEQVKKFGAVEGGRQTLARLADYLPAMPR